MKEFITISEQFLRQFSVREGLEALTKEKLTRSI